jgi:hypothetical protein
VIRSQSTTFDNTSESLGRGAYPQTLRKLATALSVEPKDLL